MRFEVLDHGYVALVDKMGTDLSPLEAARMSTGNPTGVDEAKDDKLRRYLWRNHHASPFEFAQLVVEMQAPIFVARQIFRHRTFSFNEFSARYAEMPELFYLPSEWRAQASTNNQGSEGIIEDNSPWKMEYAYEKAVHTAFATYEELIEKGVTREQARMVLPVGAYTRWRQSGNLRNWLHLLNLRLDEHTQWETRQYADALSAIIKANWPKTWEVFEESRT